MLRLGWFITEMQEWLMLIRRQDQIISAPDYFSISDTEQKLRLKPVNDKWRDFFTKISWNKFYAKHNPALRKEKIEKKM
ncbi:MAG: hypothetical protein AC479_03905 [miscellaneous Crenarchaeota group-6 archaeon AD8-1]|nr:MAG: hypothetical protein AC479_03905 [miscellaneous Crenarchaeota group-6 archaeon AD8-1]